MAVFKNISMELSPTVILKLIKRCLKYKIELMESVTRIPDFQERMNAHFPPYYRTISIISKVFEAINENVVGNLDKNRLLSDMQYRFRSA